MDENDDDWRLSKIDDMIECVRLIHHWNEILHYNDKHRVDAKEFVEQFHTVNSQVIYMSENMSSEKVKQLQLLLDRIGVGNDLTGRMMNIWREDWSLMELLIFYLYCWIV